MTTNRLRVLLTNDDGPPGPDSPYIYGFYHHLVTAYGWDVKVVIPGSQKSWIGGAFQIQDIIHGKYYYPCDPNGQGETSQWSRPLKDGELAEWILLDATPATCANVGIHNLFPGEIDLVISGPNLGRNSSAAFAMSSGTVGAALSSSLCRLRSIAVSYGTVERPTPESYFQPAHVLSGQIIQRLIDNWGKDEGGLTDGNVDLYNVNIPLISGLLSDEGLKVAWTTMWRNSYGRLFKPHRPPPRKSDISSETEPGGPDAQRHGKDPASSSPPTIDQDRLVFKFSPDIKDLIFPPISSLPPCTDAWALAHGFASITPLRACFAEPSAVHGDAGDYGADSTRKIPAAKFLKLKL